MQQPYTRTRLLPAINLFQTWASVVLAIINTHMDSENIHLSGEMVPYRYPLLFPDSYSSEEAKVNAENLNYDSQKEHSLIILAGCESFYVDEGPWWYKDSPLATAVETATLSAGYPKTTSQAWNEKYLSDIFQKMANGMTFVYAEDATWNGMLESRSNGGLPIDTPTLDKLSIIRLTQNPGYTDFKLQYSSGGNSFKPPVWEEI